jgi:integrase
VEGHRSRVLHRVGARTSRELRHSFVSLLSNSGVRIEDIAELCGHAGTRVTEAVYRHQLRPVLLNGAVVMDKILDVRDGGGRAAWSVSQMRF